MRLGLLTPTRRWHQIFRRVALLVVVLLLLPTISWADPEYIQNDSVRCYATSKGFDIQFYFNNDWRRTTWNNGGYATYVSFNEGSTKTRINSGDFAFNTTYTVNSKIEVSISASVPDATSSTVKIQYTVKNLTDSPLDIKLGTCADTQVGLNDKATVYIEENENRQKYIVMEDNNPSNTDTYGAKYKISAGVGDLAFTRMWYGDYSGYSDHVFDNKTGAPYNGDDSALAWSWDITIPAGATVKRFAGGGETVLSPQTGGVVMDNYTYGATPSTPSVPDVQENPVIVYYYNTTNANSGGTQWTEMTGTSLNAGPYYMYAEINSTEHYEAFTTEAVPFTVNQREITLSWGATDFTYNRSPQKPTATAGNLVNSDACTVTVTGEQTNAGNYTATASALSNNNYKLPSSPTQEFSIGKKAITISGITASNKEYDGNTSATISTTDAAFGGLVEGDALTVSTTGTFADANVGTGKTVNLGTLTLGGTSVGNYQLATSGNQATATANITARALTITAEAKSKTYGGTDPELTYTSSGLVDGDAITGSLSRAEGENVGTYAITQGTLSAGDNYTISYTGANLTIGQAALTITANAKTITYGDAPDNDGVTYSEFVSSDTESVLSGELSYTYSYSQFGDIGSYTIKPSGLSSGNYSISYVEGPLTVNEREVTLSWSDTNLTYNRSGQKPTATAGNLVNGDVIGVTVTGDRTVVGTDYTATATALTGEKSGNYKLPSSTTQTFNIGKKAVTISGITASNKEYDGNTSATISTTDAVFGGIEEGDALTVSTTGTFADANVGTGKTVNLGTLTLGGTSIDNYELAETGNQTTATADITAKTLTITAEAKSKTYGEADPSLTYTSSGLIGEDAITGSLSRAEGENVGTYAITQGTLSAGDNYTISYTGANLTIGQAALTVTAKAKTITYGDAPANDGVTYSGFVSSESESVLGGELSYTYSYSQFGNVGSYTIKPSGLSSSNYSISYVAGPLTVNEREVTLSWSNTNLTYNRLGQKPTATAGNLVNGDVIGVTVTGDRTVVGTDYTATATALTGDKSGNYKLPSSTTQTFNIGKKAVTISGITASNKEYDGNTSATISTTNAVFGGIEGGDALTVSTTGTFADANVGTGKTVNLGTLTLGGTSIDNYELAETGNQATATADITAKSLTITAEAKSKTYGGTDPELTYTSSGLIGEDAMTGSLSRDAGEDVGTYAITQGTLSAGDNYTISYTGANLTIGQAALTVTANAKTITYGDEPTNNGVTYTGFVNSETSAVLGGELAYTYNYTQYGDTGNTYTITPSGLTSGNYEISFADGTLTVVQKEVGLEWTNTSFTYNGSEQVPTATATGLVNSDEIGVTVTGGQTNAGASYTATASELTGDKKGNYKLPSANTTTFSIATATITDITVSGYNSAYDGTAHSISASVPEGSTIKYGTAEGTYDLDETPTYTSVGNYTVYYQITMDNYTTVTGSATVKITKAALTVTANAKTITYGDEPTNDGVEYSGFVNSETSEVLGGELSYAYDYEQYDDVGSSYTITPSGLTADNYEITFATGTLTVNPLTATLSWDNTSLTYTGEAQKPTATVSNLVNGDECNVTISGEQTNAGDSYEATVTELSNSNYQLPTEVTHSFVIDKATPVVTAPTGLELEYTGNAQQLIEAGETTFGTLLYSLTEDGTYSEEIPTGTAVSTYTIWYKVDANDNWYGVDKQSVTASIMGYPVKVGAGCYATYYSDTALSTDDTDAILYTITEVGETSVTLEQITSANALMPFLVYNNSDTDKTILLQPTEAEVSLVVAKEFKGTTVNKDMPASSSETDYYVCTGKAFVWTKWAGMIGANRCWIEINDQPETSRTRTRSITGGNTTGIDSVDSGQWTDDSYYNLQGRKVAKPNRKGIYIHNGQKVVVK